MEAVASGAASIRDVDSNGVGGGNDGTVHTIDTARDVDSNGGGGRNREGGQQRRWRRIATAVVVVMTVAAVNSNGSNGVGG